MPSAQRLEVIPLRERPDVSRFFAACFEAEWPDWYGPGRAGDAAADLSAFADPSGRLPVGVVAIDDMDRPLGIAALKATSIPTHADLGPWVGAGFVVPAERRRGIGAMLLAGVAAEARRLGFERIYCATGTAVSLLRREGWSEIDTVVHDGSTLTVFELCFAGVPTQSTVPGAQSVQ